MTTVAGAYFDDDYREIGKYALGVAPGAADYQTGTRVIGCDFIANVSFQSSAYGIFTGYPAGYDNSAITLSVTPANFPRLASIASNFSRFLFRELCLEYTPMVPTSTAGGFGVGYNADSSYDANFPTGILSVMGFLKNFITPAWKPACMAIKLFNKTPFYTTWDSTASTPATQRQASQGQIVGLANSNSNTPAATGFLCAKYVCDLYGPTPPTTSLSFMTTSLSTSLKGLDEKKLLQVKSYADALKDPAPRREDKKSDPPLLLVGRPQSRHDFLHRSEPSSLTSMKDDDSESEIIYLPGSNPELVRSKGR